MVISAFIQLEADGLQLSQQFDFLNGEMAYSYLNLCLHLHLLTRKIITAFLKV